VNSLCRWHQRQHGMPPRRFESNVWPTRIYGTSLSPVTNFTAHTACRAGMCCLTPNIPKPPCLAGPKTTPCRCMCLETAVHCFADAVLNAAGFPPLLCGVARTAAMCNRDEQRDIQFLAIPVCRVTHKPHLGSCLQPCVSLMLQLPQLSNACS
jgi:hypothetical protein